MSYYMDDEPYGECSDCGEESIEGQTVDGEFVCQECINYYGLVPDDDEDE